MRSADSLGWSIVVPVKVLALAKSRLTGIPRAQRGDLVLAMACDTVAAALLSPVAHAVIAVTDDEAVGAELGALGALVIDDEPRAGLNPALAFGASVAERRWPRSGRAGLAADLPSLRPHELTRALSAAEASREAFVPDSGTGTTLYAAGPGVAFRPAFGTGSRRRHRNAGVTEIDTTSMAGLRCDVDTMADLRRAADIGLGPRTAAIVAGLPGW